MRIRASGANDAKERAVDTIRYFEIMKLREDAERAVAAGLVEEVRNPNIGLFEWTVDDVRWGIRAGIVDGWRSGGPLEVFGGDKLIGRTPVKFKDRGLGKRVADFTLDCLDDRAALTRTQRAR